VTSARQSHDPRCERCGALIPDGGARVSVPLTVDEMVGIVFGVAPNLQTRLLCAMRLVDPEQANEIERALRMVDALT